MRLLIGHNFKVCSISRDFKYGVFYKLKNTILSLTTNNSAPDQSVKIL